MIGLKSIALIGLFWLMQVGSTLFFKAGSASLTRWLWGFVLGNVLGVSSSWILMLLYKTMNPNVALGLGLGGAFLSCQVVLTVLFRTGLDWSQYLGIFGITVGMMLLALGKVS